MRKKRRKQSKTKSAPAPVKRRKRGRRRKNPSASAIGGFVVTAIAAIPAAMLARQIVSARWASVAAGASIFGLVAWKGKDWLGLEDGTRRGAMWASGLQLGAGLLFGGMAAELEQQIVGAGQAAPPQEPLPAPEVRAGQMITGQIAAGQQAALDGASGVG